MKAISNYYIPFSLSDLKKEDEKLQCGKYLDEIKKLIFLSGDIKYIVYYFVGMKDKRVKGSLK
jgi:hypothetical protein